MASLRGEYCAFAFCVDDRGIRYLAKSPFGREEIFLPIPGSFTVYNSLSAMAAALECGISFSLIREALSEMEGVPGRIERIPTETPYSVFIDTVSLVLWIHLTGYHSFDILPFVVVCHTHSTYFTDWLTAYFRTREVIVSPQLI